MKKFFKYVQQRSLSLNSRRVLFLFLNGVLYSKFLFQLVILSFHIVQNTFHYFMMLCDLTHTIIKQSILRQKSWIHLNKFKLSWRQIIFDSNKRWISSLSITITKYLLIFLIHLLCIFFNFSLANSQNIWTTAYK